MASAVAHLTVSGFQRAITFSLAYVIPASLALALVFTATRNSGAGLLWALLLLPLGLSLSYLRVALEVTFLPDELRVRSLSGSRVLPIANIKVVDARPWNRGFIAVKASNATVFFYRGMPGVQSALVRLADRNPSIVVRL